MRPRVGRELAGKRAPVPTSSPPVPLVPPRRVGGSTPTGNRTPVSALRTPRPRPLDDRGRRVGGAKRSAAEHCNITAVADGSRADRAFGKTLDGTGSA